MSALVNRVQIGRLVSLLAEVKYLKHKFNDRSFSLNEMKFDSDSEINQLHFFDLAIQHPAFGLRDPYLENILSPAGFHLTQSMQHDTQKSKAVSVCFQALQGIGWVEKVDNSNGRLTDTGHLVSELQYNSNEFGEILRDSLIKYGPFVGMLYKCVQLSNKFTCNISRSDIIIGYPNTNESVIIDDMEVILSFGSQADSITRTRSALLAWAITAGFLWPVGIEKPRTIEQWHVEALEVVKKKKFTWRQFTVENISDIHSNEFYLDHPLEYNWMTKSTKALREVGQRTVREATMQYEAIVKNRRFAIAFCLNHCALNNKSLNLNLFIDLLSNHNELFFIDSNAGIDSIIEQELEIAFITGIPFDRKNGDLIPKNNLNHLELMIGVPKDVSKIVNIIAESLVEDLYCPPLVKQFLRESCDSSYRFLQICSAIGNPMPNAGNFHYNI